MGQLPNFDFPGMNDGARDGGGDRNRTDDLMLAKHALSQLSYAPFRHGFGGQPPFATPSDEGWPATRSAQRAEWWAREDWHFRPHAYKAGPLTNRPTGPPGPQNPGAPG